MPVAVVRRYERVVQQSPNSAVIKQQFFDLSAKFRRASARPHQKAGSLLGRQLKGSPKYLRGGLLLVGHVLFRRA